jgi:hemoglobin/transferrin/lactoferrin receptor protein
VGEVLDQSLYTTGLRVDNRSRAGLGQDILGILTYGVEAYWDKGEGRTDGAPRDGVPDAKNRFLAAYVQGQIEFEKLPGGMSATILPGLRFDSYSSESSGSPENSDQEVSPKIAVQLRPVKPLTLLGSYAKAFRAPTIGELFPTGTHFVIPGFGTNSFVPNPDLKPQTTDTWEAGASLQFRDLVDSGDRFQVKGVHYWVKGKDFIDIVVFQPGPPACFPPACDGTTMSENVANARLDGYEIEARYESSRYLFSASFAHIDGEDEDTGAPLGVLTPDTLNLHAAVKLPEHDVRVGWRFIHANDFTNTDDPALERDSYNVHNAYLTWQAPRTGSFPGLGLSLGVDNIFDEAYARSASDAFEPGRNFKMTLFYRKSL